MVSIRSMLSQLSSISIVSSSTRVSPKSMMMMSPKHKAKRQAPQAQQVPGLSFSFQQQPLYCDASTSTLDLEEEEEEEEEDEEEVNPKQSNKKRCKRAFMSDNDDVSPSSSSPPPEPEPEPDYTILTKYYSHVRDANISFEPVMHKYTVRSEPSVKYTSVTTWNHCHFPKFDADRVIEKMMNGKNWNEDNKYWGMTPKQIKDMWNQMGKTSAHLGTLLHERIEKFMNNSALQPGYTHADLYRMYNDKKCRGEKEEVEPMDEIYGSAEWEFFLNFVRDHPELKPYRTEWAVYYEELRLAGMIDMVYENPDGTLAIYDWKRVNEISPINHFREYATNPLIRHLHHTNYWHYTLQLNTYKTILEEKYGKKVTKLCLVRMHSEPKKSEAAATHRRSSSPQMDDEDADASAEAQAPPELNYELIEVPFLEKDMRALFDQRRASLVPLPQRR